MSVNVSRTPLATPLGGGRTLIEASAGSGKTRAITTLVARLLVEQGREIDSILVVTFTNAATAELRERVRKTLKAVENAKGRSAAAADDQARELLKRWEQDAELDEALIKSRIELALLDIDRANIFTIHGFCQRALTEFAFETGFSFDFEISGDGGGFVTGVVRDFWQEKFRNSSRILARFLGKNRFMPEQLANWYASLRAKGFQEIRGVPDLVKDPAEAENECRQRLAAFISTWREHEAEFREIVLESDAFNRVRYQRRMIERRLSTIKKVAAKEDLPLDIEGLMESAEYLGAANASQKCKKDCELPENPLFAAFDELLEACKAFMDHLAAGLKLVRKQLIEQADAEIRRLVREQRRLGYDDLLIEMRDALENKSGGRRLAHSIRRRFPVALIDEFQDTNPTQERIFAGIYGAAETAGGQDEAADGRGALYIVGDPKQSIYQFRGADIFAYLSAQQGTESRLELGSNYRSTPRLVEACNAIFDRPLAFTIPEIGFSPATPGRDGGVRLQLDGKTAPPLQLMLLQDQQNVKDATRIAVNKTADDIIHLLNLAREGKAKIGEAPLQAADIAVLVAKRSDGREIAKALRRRGGRCVEIDDSSIFDSREAGQVYRLLLALSHRGRQDFRRAALAGDVFGLDNEDLLALIEEDDYWSYWAGKFDEWGKDWLQNGVGAMLRKIIGAEMKHWPEMESENADNNASCKVGSGNLLNAAAGPRRLTNYYHLAELLQEAETDNQYSPAGLIAWLKRRVLGQTELRGAEEDTYTLRLDNDENLVKISTIHRSKGLEFPVVYVPFAWYSRAIGNTVDEPVEYHIREGGRFPAILDLAPDDASRNRRELEQFGESVRLLYVALTRARERCVVAWTRITSDKEKELPPLAWLLHREERHEVVMHGGGAQATNAALPDSAAEVHTDLKTSLRAKDRSEFEREVSAVVSKCPRGIIKQHIGDKNAYVAVKPQEPESEAKLKPPRAFDRPVRRIRQMTSYTDLAADHAAPAHRSSETGAPDHDQSVDALADDAAKPEANSQEQNAFHFPRGVRTGNCLHKIFEIHDEEPERAIKEICKEQLQRAGIEAKWRSVARDMVKNTLKTDLREPAHGSFRLDDINRRLCELEFCFPVNGLSRPGLAETLARFGYPELLREAPGEPAIVGFLRGFIDLAFERDGRWYIADYKSNWLGNQADDYQGEQLAEAMRQHSYQLQYLLYLLALHRYLRTRIRDYDYERHIGGVFYLFLRGVNPATGMSRGVWFDRPEQACIEALDDFMEDVES